jgi:hypothetical protein
VDDDDILTNFIKDEEWKWESRHPTDQWIDGLRAKVRMETDQIDHIPDPTLNPLRAFGRVR